MKIFEKIKRALLFPLVGVIFIASFLSFTNPVFADPAPNSNNNSNNQTITPTEVQPQSPSVSPAPAITAPNTPQNQSPQNQTNQNKEPQNQNNSQPEQNQTSTENTDGEKTENASCYSQVGGLGWIVCPVAAFLSRAIDTIYNLIEDFLILEPISMDEKSPVYQIWIYARNITNIIFIIFLMAVIYSQVTGLGLSNYGIKRALPRLIIAAILINLSYLICVIAVDFSNIVGRTLHSFLASVAETAASSGQFGSSYTASFYDIFTTIAAGGVIGTLAVGLSGGPLGLLLAIIPVVLGGIISVLIGLFTISLRQAVIILLVAVAPLAFGAYLLPNTEKWFKKWTNIFAQMIFFYPMFSLLFGASKVASGIFMGSANSMLGIVLGLAVQVLPLIFGIGLMKMAGTMLGQVSGALGNLGNKANAGIKSFTDPYKNLARSKHLAKNLRKPFNPISGSSLRAASHKRNARLKFRQDQVDKTITGLTGEDLNALRTNKRIIGYNKDNQPIYTQVPFRRANRYMNEESDAREVGLRQLTNDLVVENAYGNLGDYQKEYGIKKGKAVKTAARMGGHYLDYRTQLAAKARNDEADERFYNETVIEAAKRNTVIDKDGNITSTILNQKAYDRYINSALGASGYSINQLTENGKRLANEARVNVIGDAYSKHEAQRAANIKRFEAYMDKQVTLDVVRQYEDMIKHNDVDGIIASHHILAKRGDYDKIASHMTEYFNSGAVKLGEDAANSLALNLLSMSGSAPSLARFGKFINMETWAYTSGKRKTQEVTVEQFVSGMIKDEVGADGKPVYTKISLATGLEGTKLNAIDRTAFAANDEFTNSISIANGYSYDEAKTARQNIENAMLPQIISALPTFASGSEQIRSVVGHMTGMKYNARLGQWEDNIKKDNPEDQELEKEIVKYTMDKYLDSLTARDLISMKSDTWGGIIARLKLNKVNELSKKGENYDLSNADDNKAIEKKVNEDLQVQLASRIEKIATGNMNVDMMKEKIFDALEIGKHREAALNKQRKENADFNKAYRESGGNMPNSSQNQDQNSNNTNSNQNNNNQNQRHNHKSSKQNSKNKKNKKHENSQNQ